MEDEEKQSVLKTELGVTRRDLIRRGAIVGGTLLWAAPVIQSLSPPAYAAAVSAPTVHYCCFCAHPKQNKKHCGGVCLVDTLVTSQSACTTFCSKATGTNGHKCKYQTAQFQMSPSPFTCTTPTAGCGHPV